MNVFIIDNYDSFTFNLFQYVGEVLTSKQRLGEIDRFNLIVKRNDEITLDDVIAAQPDRIIISPGPGSPTNQDYFGICSEIIKELGPKIPLLGVCLGMQGITHAFGGEIIKSDVPFHGKTSLAYHTGENVFKGIPNPTEVMRYHSLAVNPSSIPSCLKVMSVVPFSEEHNSKTDELGSGDIMAIQHKEYPIYGVQFHPESFRTESGMEMIENFLFLS